MRHAHAGHDRHRRGLHTQPERPQAHRPRTGRHQHLHLLRREVTLRPHDEHATAVLAVVPGVHVIAHPRIRGTHDLPQRRCTRGAQQRHGSASHRLAQLCHIRGRTHLEPVTT